MLSNTGADGNSDSSSGGVAGAVGVFECAAEAEVSLGFAFSAEVTANCARIDENAAAATVSTKNYLSATTMMATARWAKTKTTTMMTLATARWAAARLDSTAMTMATD